MSRFVSLAGEHVAELADRCAEAGRLSRGRALFRKGAVSDLSIIQGSVIASVRGSHGDDYDTTIGTALAPPGIIRQIAQAHDRGDRRSIDDLIDDGLDVCPREMDLAFACDCADWDEPCKHVVAVLLAFADRVDLDEAELLRWRGIDRSGSVNAGSEVRSRSGSPRRIRPATEPKPQPRSRAAAEPQSPTQSQSRSQSPTQSRSRSADRTPVDEPGDRTAKLSELEALLGDTVMRVSTTDGSDPEPPASTLEPALADFLGVGITLDPVDVSEIAAPAPLYADVQLGPLADLGPELAKALATISARLEDLSPG